MLRFWKMTGKPQNWEIFPYLNNLIFLGFSCDEI